MDDSGDSKKSMLGAVKENTLSLAGISYIIGDIGLALAGEAGGLWWLAGGLAAARYGHPKAEKQYQLLSDRLGNYLRRQGVEIPANPDTESLRRKGGVLDHIESFMYTYPSQILNTAYAIGSLLLIRSALTPKDGKRDFALAGAGALVIAGALGGLLIKEKKIDPENPPKGIVKKSKAWVEDKPLRWPAIAYGLNNVMLGISTFQNKKNNSRNSLKWLTVITYAFGNVMLALSSKTNAGNAANVSAMEKMADTAASVIVAQPKEVQEGLIHQISGYLSTQPEAHLKVEEISDLLHQKLVEVGKNSVTHPNWLQRTQLDASLTGHTL